MFGRVSWPPNPPVWVCIASPRLLKTSKPFQVIQIRIHAISVQSKAVPLFLNCVPGVTCFGAFVFRIRLRRTIAAPQRKGMRYLGFEGMSGKRSAGHGDTSATAKQGAPSYFCVFSMSYFCCAVTCFAVGSSTIVC